MLYHPQEPLLVPHIQPCNERNPEILQDFDTTDMIQHDLYSNENSENDDNVFDNDTNFSTDDDQSSMLNSELYKRAKLADKDFHHL